MKRDTRATKGGTHLEAAAKIRERVRAGLIFEPDCIDGVANLLDIALALFRSIPVGNGVARGVLCAFDKPCKLPGRPIIVEFDPAFSRSPEGVAYAGLLSNLPSGRRATELLESVLD